MKNGNAGANQDEEVFAEHYDKSHLYFVWNSFDDHEDTILDN